MSGWTNWKKKAAVQLRIIEKMTAHLNLIQKAIEAQSEDQTIWTVNIPQSASIWTADADGPGLVSIAEAYLQQSLRWLHKVCEEGDEEALKNIINQSKGEI